MPKKRSGAERLRIGLWRLLFLGGFLVLWEVAAERRWGNVDPFFTSRPTAIAGQVWAWVASGFIVPHVVVTLEEALIGLAIGAALGIVVGFAFAFSPWVADVFEPVVVLLNAVPRVVLAPLFILWFGLGLASKVVLVVSLVFFVVFFATWSGIREVDRDVVANARVMGAGEAQLIRHVLLPSALAWIFSSLRVAVGFALVGAVVGEYLGASKGMGHLIAFAESMFNATQVMAGLVILMVVVGAIDLALRWVEARFSAWKPTR
jgi:NitT/TauT family transport system permease protein